VASRTGGEILAISLRVNPDGEGNYANPIGYTPRAPGGALICVYVADGYANTFALASLTIDVQPATSTPTTPGATTTTTLPGCGGSRCEIDAAVYGPACAGNTIPRSVTKKIERAVQLIEQTETSQSQQATRLRTRARTQLSLAGKAAVKASRGKKATLSAGCAAAIQGAANPAGAGLPR